MPGHAAALLFALAALSAAAPACAASLLLSFGGYGAIAQDHGDSALADLSYRAIGPGQGDLPAAGLLYGWEAGFGGLAGAVWADCAPCGGEIRIAARDPAHLVVLERFDAAGWARDEPLDWRVYDLGWGLLGQGSGTAPDSGHARIAPGISATGGLILQWGADAYDVGLQDLAYRVDAVLPLPVPALLLPAALAALALATPIPARHRRRWRCAD
ncbi:hypothetical protein [Poseidonocella sp. HB161398]|uniref:hypothetical protein n=1 Tax=Poseidonocella sp. HB161398 TaxID=2320855 RepID=UPI00110844D9|nr:hypothetical protein [Poseidonocella sp. HB161398]